MSKKRRQLCTWCAVILLVICGLGWHHITHSYTRFDTGSQPSTIANIQKHDARSHRLEYDFAYGSCPHCRKVAPEVIPKLRHLNRTNQHLVVFSSKLTNLKTLMINEDISATPTLIIRYHGYVLFEYTGANSRIFEELMDGINPATDHRFKLKTLHHAYVWNDYNHTHRIQHANSDYHAING